MNALLELIRARRTARGPFKPDPVPSQHVRIILEAARWAPSSHNSQPWKLIVVDDPEIKKAIAELTLAVVRFDRPLLEANQRWLRFTRRDLERKKDGIYLRYFRLLPPVGRVCSQPAVGSLIDRVPAFRIVAREMAALIREAPVLICFAVDAGRWFAPMDEDLEGVLTLGACFQNMALMAAELGLGFQPLSSLIEFARGREGLQQILGHPDDWVPLSLLRIGYEKSPEVTRGRLDLDQIACRNRFGNSFEHGENGEELRETSTVQ